MATGKRARAVGALLAGLLVVAGLALLLPRVSPAQDSGYGLKANLDLPFNAGAGSPKPCFYMFMTRSVAHGAVSRNPQLFIHS